MLVLSNVEVRYSEVILVLKGMSLEVPDGGIVALLGTNGAGKTTTLKAISGLLVSEEGRVTDGSIEFDGLRMDNKGAADILRKGIAQVMEGRRVFEHLTVEENLKVGGYTTGASGVVLDMIYNYFSRLRDLCHVRSGYISGGEQQMLVLGRALMSRPKILLLDEPSLGLSPLMVKEIFRIIKRVNEDEGTSILLVEQNAQAALSLAQYGYVMDLGKVVLDGPTEKLKNNEDIKEFYLGLSEVGTQKNYREVKHYRRRKRWVG